MFCARIIVPLVLAILLSPGAPSIAHADSRARILDMHPGVSATLSPGDPFYVRIEYATDESINLWARPYLSGRPFKKAMSNASARYMGGGEALGWFALTEAGGIDEVRIIAGGGKPYREWELTRMPLQLRWTTANAATAPVPAWVEELKAVDSVRMREAAARAASEPASAAEITLFNGFMLLMLALAIAGVLVPLWSVWRWQGGWRIAAAVPAVVMAFVVLRIIVDTARDPTSHNLWPFEIVMFGGVSLAIIAVLKMARRLRGVEA